MRCHRLSSQAKPARLWHRLWCGECRAYRNVDRMLAQGVRQVRKQAVPNLGMARTLVRLQGMEQSQETAVPRVQGAWLLNKRRLLPVMSVGLVLGSIYWVQDMNADPVVDIPNPTMPKPNAFDFYKAAGMLVVQDKEMQDALLPPPPAPIKQAKGRGTYPSTTKPVHLYTLEEKAQLLEANESALTVLRKGFLYPYQEPPARSVSALFPHYANFRSLARLLNFAATVKEEQEDWQGAMNCRLEAMRLGAESQRGGPLIGKLVGIACQAIGRQATR